MSVRYLNGNIAKSAEYDALIELATICSMCNDSSVDYNEASSDTEGGNSIHGQNVFSSNNNRLTTVRIVLMYCI